MDLSKEEALKAKENAEGRFAAKDYVGAKSFALRARSLFPELDGISQMVATFKVYAAYQGKLNGEPDFYSVLGVNPSADQSMVKKKYKKLAVLLHPDKNKTVGADGAFKLVCDAWALLIDRAQRASYDLKRNDQHVSMLVSGATSAIGYDESAVTPPTFWTVCVSCQVQYEYLRKYVNKRLSCKNCRATFMAMELRMAPMSGSYSVNSWSTSSAADNGYGGSHSYNGASYYSTSGVLVAGSSFPAYQSGHGSDYASNMPFQWGTGTSSGHVGSTGYPSGPVETIHQKTAYVPKPGKKVKAGTVSVNNAAVDLNYASGSYRYTNPVTKGSRPYKKRKVDLGSWGSVSNNEVGGKIVSGSAAASNGNVISSSTFNPKLTGATESAKRQNLALPILDARSLLINKVRTGIVKKLREMKSTSALRNHSIFGSVAGKISGAVRKSYLDISKSVSKRSGPITLIVPDPDFHDFDKDRSEECFKPRQIWAVYDEEDGMPRVYCLIRDVISVNPFRAHISYLTSKTDSEFGMVNWIQYGFTKSCGHFRAFNSDVVDQLNMFSHPLSKEKTGRGGCVRIYPRSGDIWAVYRNWSPKWNSSTPFEVRHQYEMVEVLEDYSEELGVWVTPLVKLDGFKTVYQRNTGNNSMQWIPWREMLRFSHQVPSWLIEEQKDLPDRCWDLDPAAMSEELLQTISEVKHDAKPSRVDT